MSFGTLAAMEALRKQVRRQQADLNDRMARRREASAGRGQAEAAEEALGCPACQARYDFGDDCPRCAVPLVGVSFLSAVSAEAPAPALRPRTGPRYRCETCSTRQDAAGTCRGCGGVDFLDLHSAADLQLLEAQEALIEARRRQRWRLVVPVGVGLSLALLALMMATPGNPLSGGMRVGHVGVVVGVWLLPAVAILAARLKARSTD